MGSSPEGHPADVVDVLRRLHATGYCFHLSSSGDHSGGLFDQILRVFMEEVDQRKIILPFPAVIGDGMAVDLFKLYRAVAERGGYGAVSGDQSWGAVAAELGLTPNLAPAVKAVHFKYLGGLNPLLKRVLGEVELGWRESLSSSVCESSAPAERKGSGRGFSTPEDVLKSHGGSSSSGVTILDPAVGGEAFSSLKRKWEARSEMLDWVLGAARCQSDPSVGWMMASSDDDQVLGDDAAVLMSQALMARKMMFSKPILWMKDDGSPFEKLRKRQKVNPGLYGDNRCSNRNRPPNKHSAAAGGRSSNRRNLRRSSALPDASGLQCKDPQKRIPIGPLFQAEIPEWTGKPVAYGDSDDQKWLGTEIWSSERGRTPIGKGRDVACVCESPGSVDCFRLHVADKRRQLKCELGSAFVDLGFNDMGEEIALTWTEEEERRFKALVRLYPPSHRKNFWNQRGFSFPSKGSRGVVSYYFNVFLLRRRRYQNRVTPDSIDSDNEERDYDFLSRPFSLDALKAPVLLDEDNSRGAMTTLSQSKQNEVSDNPNARGAMTTLTTLSQSKQNDVSDNPNVLGAMTTLTTLSKPNEVSDNPNARGARTTLSQSKQNELADNPLKAAFWAPNVVFVDLTSDEDSS